MTKEEQSIQNVPATMAGLMMCLFLSALDNSIVSTAMPQIIKDLHGLQYYSLPFTSYLLFSTVVIPIAGKLSDVFGRKQVVLWGIGMFMLTSLLCGLSVNMYMLIIFRGLQGACSGVLASSSFIITSELFPPKDRAKYIGMLASMHGLASLLGPVTGGLIADYWSWHWIFFVNIPIGFIALSFINLHIPLLRHSENANSLDVKGILVFLCGIFPLLLCFAEGGKMLPWNSPITICLLILSIAMLFWFTRLERNSASPLLPTGLLKNATFKQSAFAAAMAYVALFGLILYVPYLLQIVMGKGAAFSGMVMLPMSLSMVAGGMAGGMLSGKLQRYRLQGVANLTLAAAGMLILLLAGTSISIATLVTAIILTSLGIGMNFPIINIAPQSVFPAAQLGIVISTIEFFQVMGGVISTSVSGSMLHTSLSGILIFSILALVLGIISMSRLNDKIIKEGFARQMHGL
jgi:MFS family permease